MRLLSLLYPSNHPNYAADSIYTFNRTLLSSSRVREAARVETVGPASMPPLAADVPHHPLELGVNKYQVRLGFDWSGLRRVLSTTRPDVVLVNMPEQAAALRILLRDDLGLPSRLVSYVHYIPAHIGGLDSTINYEASMGDLANARLVVGRLLEGVSASDLTLTCSEFARHLLQVLAARLRHPEEGRGRLAVLHPPVDLAEAAPGLEARRSARPMVVYNHRLYNEYGTMIMLTIMRELWRRVPELRVLVTNPTHGRSPERRRPNLDVDRALHELSGMTFVDVRHFDLRSDYYRALGASWAGLGPHKPNALWSMSMVDVLATGRPVVAFDLPAFREMGVPEAHLGQSVDEIVDRLEGLLLGRADDRPRRDLTAIASRYAAAPMARTFLELISELAVGHEGRGAQTDEVVVRP